MHARRRTADQSASGFEKEDPMAEFLKYKDLVIHHPIDDKDVLPTSFAASCSNVFKAMVPFNKFLNTAIGRI
ncbi:MAG TPA: DUF2461 family protein [Nitrospirota bacterium]